MKHYTSKLLKSVAIFYLCFPLLYVWMAAILYDIPVNQWLRILLSPLYWLVGGLAMLTGYGLWEMRRWSWYLLLVSNVFISYESAILVNDYGVSHHKGMAFLASIAILIILTYRVAREIRVPYFFPKIRWWESNPRYRLSVPVQLGRKNGEQSKQLAKQSAEQSVEQLAAQILDLSTGGCFVKMRMELELDEKIQVKFSIFNHSVSCEGIVVWRTPSTVTHPKGVGVKFLPMERSVKRELKLITQRLKKIASFYRRSRYLLSQDEFLKRLEEIESSNIKHHQHLHTG